MTLLCANITYNAKNCYTPRTLEKGAFQDYIKGFTDPGPEPLELIQDIFDRKSNARMLKMVMSVMAYIPNKRETTIDKLFEAMQAQSKHASKNKLSSAARTLSTLLCDWLRQCSPQSVTSVPVQKQPEIEHVYTTQSAMDVNKFTNHKLRFSAANDNNLKDWIPECIKSDRWLAFLRNPFKLETLRQFTRDCLASNQQRAKSNEVMPPYRITFKSITMDVLPIKNGTQKLDVCHMNAYQIILGIVYTLQTSLSGILVKDILNNVEITNAIQYITRYCYATRSAPFTTMHGACADYNITHKPWLNSCEGDDEVIPVTVLLVSMYRLVWAKLKTIASSAILDL